jgi:hypothetical protein
MDAGADLKGILPPHQITGRHQYAGHLATTFVDVLARHLRQLAALALARALIPVFELVQIVAVLRIEERQRRATIRQ